MMAALVVAWFIIILIVLTAPRSSAISDDEL